MENTTQNTFKLSIRINLDGFLLSVYDQTSKLTTKKVDASLATLTIDEITRLLDTETQLNYLTIQLIFETDCYTFIPADIFRMEDAIDYLSFEHTLTPHESVLFNKIQSWNVVNVFSVPDNLHKALKQVFPNTVIEHHVSWFLSEKVLLQEPNCVFCWVREKTFDMVVLCDGKIQLINSFAYQTPEDFCYFTLNVYEKLGLETEKYELNLFNAANKPEIANLLEKYLTIIIKQ
jgi:hypothetical protein